MSFERRQQRRRGAHVIGEAAAHRMPPARGPVRRRADSAADDALELIDRVGTSAGGSTVAAAQARIDRRRRFVDPATAGQPRAGGDQLAAAGRSIVVGNGGGFDQHVSHAARPDRRVGRRERQRLREREAERIAQIGSRWRDSGAAGRPARRRRPLVARDRLRGARATSPVSRVGSCKPAIIMTR